jgi:hypothetical protein
MHITAAQLMSIATLIAGVLVLFMPRCLSYVVAIYLIAVGLTGLNGIYHFVKWDMGADHELNHGSIFADSSLRRCLPWLVVLGVAADARTPETNAPLGSHTALSVHMGLLRKHQQTQKTRRWTGALTSHQGGLLRSTFLPFSERANGPR